MPRFLLKLITVFILCIGPLAVKAQIAGFTADDTAGCAPLVVHFTNTSTGATSYSWNLGDGSSPSTFTNASGAYTAVGTYTVTLTAYNGASSSTYSMVIRIYSIPTVSFTVSDTSICPGTNATFNSTSIPGAWGGLTYTWNFGDGGASTSSSPVHSYGAPGFYNVTLYATNSKGCVNSHTSYGYMHVFTPATVGFTASSTNLCRTPGTTTFTNTTTGTGPLTYSWKFGDGGTSAATSPAHTYTTGTYGVTLKVTDGNGCIDSLVKPAYIAVGNLDAIFTAVSTGCQNVPITFNNTSTPHISSQWNFGDGATSTDETGIHAYATAGTYTVRLIVYGGGSCYDTITHPITIVATPTGTFAISPTSPCPPPTALTLTASVPAGCTVTWKYGDSTTALGSGNVVTHTYAYSRIYPISMIITNSNGCKDTVEKRDTLYNLRLSTSTTYPLSGCIPLAINFSSYDYSVVFNPFVPDSMYVSYPYPISSYSWNFGDGSPAATAATPVHTFTAVGVFTVTCTITTSNGCTATATMAIATGTPPLPSFTAAPRHVCTDKTTTFTSTSTGLFDFFQWNFGDGGSISGTTSGFGYPTTVHVDSVPGIHAVSLLLTYHGCPGVPFIVTDTVDPPKSSIYYGYTCIPKNGINFTDGSIGDDSHLWIFGDGATSTISNPVHYYPALTTYTVKLATYNSASGCRDTSTRNINLTPPLVDFYTINPKNICRDRIDTFNSTVIGSTPVMKYWWYDNGVAMDSLGAVFMDYFHVRGLHTITLVIKDSRTCLDTFTRTNYILVAKPIDSVTYTPPAGCAPLIVNFTDHSTDVAGAPIKNYFWSFGDGDSTTGLYPSIVHTYTANGTYPIRQIVTDTFGCRDTMHATTITINKPAAAFSITATSVCTNTNVHFTNSSTGYSSAVWTFGDGATSTVTAPNHTYTTSGTYTVRLVVLSGLGCADTLTRVNYITVNPAPHASFYMDDSFAICPPLNVSFTNTSTGASSYYWDLGDGTTSLTTTPGDIYVVPGLYTVKLTAISLNGCTDTATGHAKIFGYSGAFSYTPVSGCSPLSVHFTATLASATSIVWDYNDGVTSGFSTADTISHTYRAAGAYIPKLIMTDSSGCSSFSLGADTIKVDTVIANFYTVPNPICQNTVITFHDTSLSYFSTIASRSWTLATGVTSTSPAPTYTYTATGTFPVTLSATDGNGCTGVITRTVTVNPAPPAITGVSSVCALSTTSLFEPGSGVWSISGTPGIASVVSTSGLVTGITPGSTAVKFTLSSSGCSAVTTVNVYPAPGAITGPGVVCSGLSILLADTTTGGSWSSSNPAIASVGTGSGLVRGVSSGTVNITYSFTPSCFSIKTITVNDFPTGIIGSPVACVGTTTLESDAVPGGTWTSSNLSVATIGSLSGIVSGLTPGTTIITYSIGGTCVVSRTMTVNLSTAPITGVLSTCTASTTTLSDISPGGIWSCSSPSIATVSTGGVVTGLLPGTDTIFYTIGTSSCIASAVVTVYPMPAAIMGPSSVCQRASITLTNSIPGGTWSSSNTLLATVGSADGIVTGAGGGTVNITYTTGAGCIKIKVITVNPIALITGLTALCSGHTSALSDATPGGTWGSSNLSVATVVSGTGAVSSLAPGTSTITYLLPSGCSATVMVSVNSSPAPITGNPHVCLGSTSLLTGGGGGTWSSANTSIATIGSATGILGGAALGTTTITYSLGSGCTTYTAVTVNPLPLGTSGASGVCAGSSITLTNLTPGGGLWTADGSGNATAGSTTGLISGVLAGVDTITFTAGTGCSTRKIVTVNPLPPNISGGSSVCIGGIVPYTDAVTGGTWASSNLSVATIHLTSGFLYTLIAGLTTIKYTAPTGCVITKTVTVNALPDSITGVTSICIGSTTTFSDAAGGGVWSSGNPPVATISTSGVVTGLANGVATISYSMGSSCIAIKTVTVYPLPLAIAGPSTVCAGSVINLTDPVPGGSWHSSDIFIATTTLDSGHVTGVNAGTALISYSLGTGCTTSKMVTVNPAPLGISGIPHVCLGQTRVLTDATPGGIWGTDNPTVASVSPTGTVYGLVTGTAVISYLQGGCPASVTFSVDPLPGPILGSTFMCLYLPYTFSNSVSGGTWSSPGGVGILSVGVTSGTISGIALGSAAITYTTPGGCTTSTTVTVNPVPPPISGILDICVGGSTILSNPSSTGTWSNGNPVVASIVPLGGGSCFVSGLSAGTAPISYSQAGCPAIANVVVNPLPAPITGPGSVCAFGDTIQLVETTTGGSWSSSLATVSPSGVVTGFSAGTAVISYILPTGCKAFDTIIVKPIPAIITGANNLCITMSTLLSDTSAGGIWSISPPGIAAISSSGMVSGIAAGTTVVSYTVPATGCKRTDTVYVHSLPSPVSGVSSVCVGSITVLSDTSGGGAWSSSNTSIATAGPSSGIITGVSAGTAVITYFLGAGCIASRVVTVNPLPTAFALTGGGNYCAGTGGVPIGLSGSEIGMTYRLYNGVALAGTVVATGPLPDFGLHTAIGTYKVVAINSATTCVNNFTDSVIVTMSPSVTPAVTIGTNTGTTICTGTPVIFTAAATNGGTAPAYQWSVNGVPAGTGSATYTYLPLNNDIVSVLLTSAATCAIPDTVSSSLTMTVDTSVSIFVTITAVPGINIKPGQPDTLTASVTGGGASLSYQWMINSSPIPGATSSMYIGTFNNGDTVSCLVTGNGICNPSIAGAQVITVGNVGVGSIVVPADEVKVLPNPNKGEFTITGNLGISKDEEVSIEITDLLGQVVYDHKTKTNNGRLNEHISLKNTLASGIYLLSLKTTSGNKVFHIVKE